MLISSGATAVLAEQMGTASDPNGPWLTTSGGSLPSPVAIAGGQTLVVVANDVSVTQVTLSAHGLNGASVTGSVTL